MKVNYELEIKLTGFIQVEVDDDVDKEDLQNYVTSDYTSEELLYMLQNGKFASELETDIDVLQHAVIEEEK